MTPLPIDLKMSVLASSTNALAVIARSKQAALIVAVSDREWGPLQYDAWANSQVTDSPAPEISGLPKHWRGRSVSCFNPKPLPGGIIAPRWSLSLYAAPGVSWVQALRGALGSEMTITRLGRRVKERLEPGWIIVAYWLSCFAEGTPPLWAHGELHGVLRVLRPLLIYSDGAAAQLLRQGARPLIGATAWIVKAGPGRQPFVALPRGPLAALDVLRAYARHLWTDQARQACMIMAALSRVNGKEARERASVAQNLLFATATLARWQWGAVTPAGLRPIVEGEVGECSAWAQTLALADPTLPGLDEPGLRWLLGEGLRIEPVGFVVREIHVGGRAAVVDARGQRPTVVAHSDEVQALQREIADGARFDITGRWIVEVPAGDELRARLGIRVVRLLVADQARCGWVSLDAQRGGRWVVPFTLKRSVPPSWRVAMAPEIASLLYPFLTRLWRDLVTGGAIRPLLKARTLRVAPDDDVAGEGPTGRSRSLPTRRLIRLIRSGNGVETGVSVVMPESTRDRKKPYNHAVPGHLRYTGQAEIPDEVTAKWRALGVTRQRAILDEALARGGRGMAALQVVKRLGPQGPEDAASYPLPSGWTFVKGHRRGTREAPPRRVLRPAKSERGRDGDQ